MFAGARRSEPKLEPKHERPTERPWLSREAAAQIVAPGGGLGPLFDGVLLGGYAPPAEIRERIVKFARANDVAIDLDITGGVVDSIRFDVTYAGGVGYEGADVFALRFDRPSTGNCCVCGPDTWINDWTIEKEGTWAHVRVDVNRVKVIWKPTLATPELLERADALLGVNERELAAEAGWVHHFAGAYTLAIPYPSPIEVTVDRGRITEVRLKIADTWHDERAWELATSSLRDRWGRPRIDDDQWTWRTADRVVTADLDGGALTILTPAAARNAERERRAAAL